MKRQTASRLELCDWNETIHARTEKCTDHYSLKTRSRGKVTESEIARETGLDCDDIERLIVAIGRAVHDGYDVHLCEAIRFYSCIAKAKTPYIAAQTIGNFRRSIADKSVRPVHHGKVITLREVARLDANARSNRLHITPDTVVTCPKCGTEIRVGKQLV